MDENSTFIDYQNINVKSSDPKEILNNLLKKMLDHKLNKLEKKHVEESNSLKIMSKISQNIIITLDHYSHKVRKEIYKLRHKNDESHTKKDSEISKKLNENTSNIDNNIESLINKDKDLKDNKLILDNKLKKPSKSIDPKKDKSFYSEKSGKKDKMGDFERLASKSIGNFKKLKLVLNDPSNNNNNHLFTSKSKYKKKNASTKNLHNILNKKNEGEKTNEHSPSNKSTPYNTEGKNSKINSKLVSTPKSKPKKLKKIAQINIENTIKTESSKSFYNPSKIKKTNSKAKLSHKLSKNIIKKEEVKNIDNSNKIMEKRKSKNDISSDIKENNDNNKDNKISEIKIEKTIFSKIHNSKKELVPISSKQLKGSLLMDDIIKDVNKDELLVSQIKDEEQFEEINEISAINLDDLNLKESMNLNINMENNDNIENIENIEIPENHDNQIKENAENKEINENHETHENIQNNELKKKTTGDLTNNSVNNSNSISNNNNKTINNIKTISSENKNLENNSNISNNNHSSSNINTNNDKSKSSNNINNIILGNPKKRPVDFLENDTEVNFTLVEDSHLEENDNDKTIDLNISGLSDQLSLEEKFEAHLDEISRYLDMKDLCNLMLLNKECFTTIMNVLISKTEITIDILEEEINKLKEINKDIDFSKINVPPFKFSSNSARAISLLNNSTECNLIKFNKGEKINNEIFMVFGIFFIAAGKKKEFLRLNNEEEKINYICNYFKNDIQKMSLGSLIEKEINGKIFDNNIISSLYKYSHKYINIISPNRFQKTNKDVAIFVFVVKNILEHIGALDQQNIKPDKEYILYNARLKDNKIILEQLNNFFDKIN